MLLNFFLRTPEMQFIIDITTQARQQPINLNCLFGVSKPVKTSAIVLTINHLKGNCAHSFPAPSIPTLLLVIIDPLMTISSLSKQKYKTTVSSENGVFDETKYIIYIDIYVENINFDIFTCNSGTFQPNVFGVEHLLEVYFLFGDGECLAEFGGSATEILFPELCSPVLPFCRPQTSHSLHSCHGLQRSEQVLVVIVQVNILAETL